MGTRQAAQILTLLAVLLLLGACGGGVPPVYEYSGYLTEDIPPCRPVEGSEVDPCDPDAGTITPSGESSIILGSEPLGMSHFLNSTSLDVAHLVVRGTYLPDTVRCADTAMLFRPPSYDTHDWESFLGPAHLINCYVDVRVNEYILGSGPPTLTVLVAYNFYGYEFPEDVERSRRNLEQTLLVGGEHSIVWVPDGGIEGREVILFVGPSVNAASEAWEEMYAWDVVRRSGKVVAIHPYSQYWKGDARQTHIDALEMEIPALTTAVQAAHQARLTAHGGRTGPDTSWPMLQTDANRLSDFFTAIGAGQQVKPTPPCGLSVPDQVDNPDLMLECAALLASKDELAGTADLNWDTATAIGSWDGVTTEGTPARVTKLLLDDEDLTGTIPDGLGILTSLTHLELSDNSLTGAIPRSIGRLDDLVEVRLSGNSLTGCIPYGLKSVTTNDLASLGLLYCPPPPDTVRGGISTETTMPLTWTAVASATKYRVEYRGNHWTVDADDITGTSHTVDGLYCREAYQFRVSAYGDGTTYPAVWSDPSEPLTRVTASCSPPTFSEDPYRFTIRDDAPVGTVIGTISATDDSGGAVVYQPYEWGPGAFAADRLEINEQTGAITVEQSLINPPVNQAGITVHAYDEAGGRAEADVLIEIEPSCGSGTAVSNAASNPGLLADCNTLLGLQSALAGTVTLNWSTGLNIRDWDGVRLGGSPQRVTRLELDREGLTGSVPVELGNLEKLERLKLDRNDLTGSIPATLGRLTELESLYLNLNDLTGPIPVELGTLTNLDSVYLYDNDLTGAIPSELGNLTEVYDLWLHDNDLTGPIPPELGNMTDLSRLWLAGNGLTGTIPAELTNLTLTLLLLYGNSLEGCVPPSLKDVDLNDMDSLGLTDCQEGPAAPTGLSASLVDDTFVVTWTALSGVDEYEAQWRIEGLQRSMGGPGDGRHRQRHLHADGRTPVLVDLRVPGAGPRGRLHIHHPLGA